MLCRGDGILEGFALGTRRCRRLPHGLALRRRADHAAVAVLAPRTDAAKDLGTIIGEIAVIGPHRAVLHEPQSIGHKLNEMHVVRDQDDRAVIDVERLDQRAPALDVEMVGGLVEHQQLRRLAGDERKVEPRLLPARKRCNRHIRLLPAEAEGAEAGADTVGRGVGHEARQVAERRARRLQHVDLMLREIADRELGHPCHGAPIQRQQVRQQLGEGGLAVAVRAEERNPFARVDSQV